MDHRRTLGSSEGGAGEGRVALGFVQACLGSLHQSDAHQGLGKLRPVLAVPAPAPRWHQSLVLTLPAVGSRPHLRTASGAALPGASSASCGFCCLGSSPSGTKGLGLSRSHRPAITISFLALMLFPHFPGWMRADRLASPGPGFPASDTVQVTNASALFQVLVILVKKECNNVKLICKP